MKTQCLVWFDEAIAEGDGTERGWSSGDRFRGKLSKPVGSDSPWPPCLAFLPPGCGTGPLWNEGLQGRRERITILVLWLPAGERGASSYDWFWGRGILVSTTHFKGERGTGDRRGGEGQRKLASEALPMSFISKDSACQGAILLGILFCVWQNKHNWLSVGVELKWLE